MLSAVSFGDVLRKKIIVISGSFLYVASSLAHEFPRTLETKQHFIPTLQWLTAEKISSILAKNLENTKLFPVTLKDLQAKIISRVLQKNPQFFTKQEVAKLWKFKQEVSIDLGPTGLNVVLEKDVANCAISTNGHYILLAQLYGSLFPSENSTRSKLTFISLTNPSIVRELLYCGATNQDAPIVFMSFSPDNSVFLVTQPYNVHVYRTVDFLSNSKEQLIGSFKFSEPVLVAKFYFKNKLLIVGTSKRLYKIDIRLKQIESYELQGYVNFADFSTYRDEKLLIVKCLESSDSIFSSEERVVNILLVLELATGNVIKVLRDCGPIKKLFSCGGSDILCFALDNSYYFDMEECLRSGSYELKLIDDPQEINDFSNATPVETDKGEKYVLFDVFACKKNCAIRVFVESRNDSDVYHNKFKLQLSEIFSGLSLDILGDFKGHLSLPSIKNGWFSPLFPIAVSVDGNYLLIVDSGKLVVYTAETDISIETLVTLLQQAKHA